QVTVAGQLVNITQNLKCGRFALLKPSAEFGTAPVYSQPLSFTTGLHCDWALTTDVPWIKFDGPASGKGLIETKYTIDTVNFNPNKRVGKITAGDQSFTVTQQGIGASCQPQSIAVGQTVTATINANCKSLSYQPELAIPSSYYKFTGSAGQRIVITATSFAN